MEQVLKVKDREQAEDRDDAETGEIVTRCGSRQVQPDLPAGIQGQAGEDPMAPTEVLLMAISKNIPVRIYFLTDCREQIDR